MWFFVFWQIFILVIVWFICFNHFITSCFIWQLGKQMYQTYGGNDVIAMTVSDTVAIHEEHLRVKRQVNEQIKWTFLWMENCHFYFSLEGQATGWMKRNFNIFPIHFLTQIGIYNTKDVVAMFPLGEHWNFGQRNAKKCSYAQNLQIWLPANMKSEKYTKFSKTPKFTKTQLFNKFRDFRPTRKLLPARSRSPRTRTEALTLLPCSGLSCSCPSDSSCSPARPCAHSGIWTPERTPSSTGWPWLGRRRINYFWLFLI